MLYNHNKEPVWSCADAEDSYCPECGGKLIPKKGSEKVWHWAHAPGAAMNADKHVMSETEWHLKMKMVYKELKDWEVEYPLRIDGKRITVDAYNKKTGEIRMFMHLNTKEYYTHLRALIPVKHRVVCLLDGAWHMSARYRVYRKSRMSKLGKKNTMAFLLDELQPKDILMHLKDHESFYKKGKRDVWLPTGPGCAKIQTAFDNLDMEAIYEKGIKLQTRKAAKKIEV